MNALAESDKRHTGVATTSEQAHTLTIIFLSIKRRLGTDTASLKIQHKSTVTAAVAVAVDYVHVQVASCGLNIQTPLHPNQHAITIYTHCHTRCTLVKRKMPLFNQKPP